MKALILAAGLGTRLKPLTNDKPKALVGVAGKPMLEWVILKLKKAGIREIIINIHHFPDQVLAFLDENKNFGLDIAISDERDELLDSGGAILKAAAYFDDGKPFLVHNVDILSELDIADLASYHISKDALATLAVRQRKTSRYLLFDEAMCLRGWENTLNGDNKGMKSTEETPLSQLAFSGIYMISPELVPLITEKGAFPVIDLLLRLAPDHLIQGYRHDEGLWFDLGKAETIQQASAFLNLNHNG